VIVVDTSVILAYMNSADEHHKPVLKWLLQADDDLVTTPLIVAEADHLVAARGGRVAASALRADLAAGAYVLDWWPQAIATAVRVADRYDDMPLGLANASLVALAERHETVKIATLDERHFRAIRPLAAGRAFRLLPADA
jgi:uncharacterized protein